jgi:WD40-like Beta Propeller Repeat
MKVLAGTMAWLPGCARRQLLWRSLLAAPFTLSLVLTLVLGPATITSVHGSFTWLAVVSLVAVLLMLSVTERLLIPLGLVTFLVFPELAGLGYNFAPNWARPIVAIIFYGSMLASVAAALRGIVVILRSVWRTYLRAVAIAAGGIGLLALAAVAAVAVSTLSSATGQAPGTVSKAVNLGPVINTGHREAEASFTADGRTMVFNCNSTDICVSHLTGSWEQANWTPPQLLGPPISTAYVEVEPWINTTGDKLYFNSSRPFAAGKSMPGLALYVDAIGLVSMELGVSPFGGLGQDDIWVSFLTDGVWSEPRNLNDLAGEPPVNTGFMDHCLAFSADGNEAFWTSTRPGGFGSNDIWTSRRVDGRWTAPENLGPHVNGPGSDHHSIPTPDGRSLYITTTRTEGFGGEDMYVTMRGDDGTWGPLFNLGPLVNGPGNDRCAAWTPDGMIFLFDSDRSGGFGGKDIWWVYFQDVMGHPPAAASGSAGGPEP